MEEKQQPLQEKVEHKAQDAHAAGEHENKGPLSEADWVAVGFVIFVLLIWRKVWPKFAASLDARSDKISQDLQKAALLKEEATVLLAETKKRAQDSEKAAAEMIATAKAEAKRILAATEADLKEDTERKIVLLQAKIKRAENQAIENVKKQAVEEATKIAESLLTEKASNKNVQKKLTEDSIAKILANVN